MFSSQMSELFNYLISPFNFLKVFKVLPGGIQVKRTSQVCPHPVSFCMYWNNAYVHYSYLTVLLIYICWVNITHCVYHTSQEDEGLVAVYVKGLCRLSLMDRSSLGGLKAPLAKVMGNVITVSGTLCKHNWGRQHLIFYYELFSDLWRHLSKTWMFTQTTFYFNSNAGK